MSERRRGPRISIEERAARRDYVMSRGRDRFAALLRVLQGGREMPIERRRRFDIDWPSIRWLALKIGAALVVSWFVGTFSLGLIRDLRVDTWTGPDGSVQSGQRLAGCAPVNVLHDDTYPIWIRYGGVVFRLQGLQLRVADPAAGGTGFSESGYSLGEMRLLTEGSASAVERQQVMVILPPAAAAEVYVKTAECA